MRKRRRSPKRSKGEPEIAQRILAYLAEHPQAQDTLEGIVHWWLLEQQIKYWAAQVETALGDLVAQGLVIESKGRDGQIRYRLNQDRSTQVRALLDQT